MNRKSQAHRAQHILASMSHLRTLSMSKFGPHCIQNVYVVMFLGSVYAKRWGVKSVMMGVMLILIYFR